MWSLTLDDLTQKYSSTELIDDALFSALVEHRDSNECQIRCHSALEHLVFPSGPVARGISGNH